MTKLEQEWDLNTVVCGYSVLSNTTNNIICKNRLVLLCN